MNRLPYDICIISPTKPITLTTRELDQLQTALKKDPSLRFKKMYARAITSYCEYKNELENVKPASIHGHVKEIVKLSAELHQKLCGLSISERVFVNRFVHDKTQEYQDAIDKQVESLSRFISIASDAKEVLDQMQKKGAMPAYAEQGMAAAILRALYLEFGKVPACSRGGLFDSVLKVALNTAAKRAGSSNGYVKEVKEVMDVMRIAKDSFDVEEANRFGEQFA